MKNTKYLVILVLLLVLGGLVYLIYGQKKASPAELAAASPSPAAVNSGPASLRDLLKSSVPQTCTFSSLDSVNETKGTIYVESGALRGDVTNTAGKKTTVTHILAVDSTLYTWIDGQTAGYKMAFDMNALPSPAASGANSQATFDMEAKNNLQCSPGSIDRTLLAVPSAVKFTDLSALMKSPAPTAATGSGSVQCSACSQLSGAAKTQCLSYLHCQ